jgi:hypothetical protein
MMRKYILLILLLLSVAAPVLAQRTESDIEDEELDIDDIGESGIKIMIIPFNPSYHKRDISQDLKQYSEKFNKEKVQEVKAWFSFGLDENISPRILTLGSSQEKKVLLNDFATDTDNDIKKIYSNIEYRAEKRDKKYGNKNAMLVDNLMGKLKQGKATSSMNFHQDYESDKKHKEYTNVYIADPTILPHVAERYGVQLFVFINQFEIFTDYKKCLDQENKIYQRQIKLHFSIFDRDGDQLYGDLAVISFYPTVSKDIDQIIMERFPVVANYFSRAFPDASEE